MIRKTENRKVASSLAAVASQMAFVNHGCSVPSVPVAGQHYWKLLLALPKLRVARPTDDIEALIRFYGDGLGLEILYRFEDHDGFDGVMLGHAGAPYHFEFTKAHGHTVGRAPTRDNLLVFGLPDPGEWQVAVERMEGAGFRAVPAFNPYWDRSGRTFEDPDGYRVVIQRADWNA